MNTKYLLCFIVLFYKFNYSQEIKIFNETNSPLIPGYLSALVIDSSNNIWIGGYKEFYKYYGNWENIQESWNLPEDLSVNDLEISTNGSVWASIYYDYNLTNLIKFSNEQLYLFDFEGTYITGDIFIENDSTIYCTLINYWENLLYNDKIAILKNDSINTVWCSAVKNIVSFSEDTLIATSPAFGVAKIINDTIIEITPQNWEPLGVAKIDNQIFVYSERLSKYENGLYINYPKIDSILSSDTLIITSMAMEGNDILWIGTDKGKLIKFDSSISVYKLSNYSIKDIEIDKYKNKWLISYDGCFVFNEDKIVNVNKETAFPDNFILYQNYPNPFNPSTVIEYSIPFNVETHGHASLQLIVYDVLGSEVVTLVNQTQKPGNYSVHFDGNKLSSGIYFYQLKFGNFVETKKMILLK